MEFEVNCCIFVFMWKEVNYKEFVDYLSSKDSYRKEDNCMHSFYYQGIKCIAERWHGLVQDTLRIRVNKPLDYYFDKHRHLVCIPYSIENLHTMAEDLGIKRCWFHKNHYDIPKEQMRYIHDKCQLVNSRTIVKIINNDLEESNRKEV